MFNFQTPDSFWATFYSNNRMLIASRQDPLQIQLGVRYEF
jgi:hypothetical protein